MSEAIRRVNEIYQDMIKQVGSADNADTGIYSCFVRTKADADVCRAKIVEYNTKGYPIEENRIKLNDAVGEAGLYLSPMQAFQLDTGFSSLVAFQGSQSYGTPPILATMGSSFQKNDINNIHSGGEKLYIFVVILTRSHAQPVATNANIRELKSAFYGEANNIELRLTFGGERSGMQLLFAAYICDAITCISRESSAKDNMSWISRSYVIRAPGLSRVEDMYLDRGPEGAAV